jgi:hypothetical protein
MYALVSSLANRDVSHPLFKMTNTANWPRKLSRLLEVNFDALALHFNFSSAMNSRWIFFLGPKNHSQN